MKSRLRLLTAVLASWLAVPGLAGRPTIDVGAMVQPTPLTARFSDPGYFVWDGAPVKGDDGKYHLYYMFYMGNRGDRVKAKGLNYSHRNNQRVGLAVADRLEGPWRRFDQPIIDASSDKTAFDSLCVTNPAATMRPSAERLSELTLPLKPNPPLKPKSNEPSAFKRRILCMVRAVFVETL